MKNMEGRGHGLF